MNNTTKKIRWGIISTAKIGTEHVIPAVLASKDSELAAIASRDKAKAQKTAKQFKIPKAYGSYEELFKDPDIDAIYNPLPNDMHALFSVQALKAGKHILCEKPAGIKVSELLEVKKHVGDRIFMEAFMVRFHPQWHKALELVKSKKIGDIRAMQVFFSFYNDDPKNIRNILKNGGGAMFDIGCYPLTVSRFIFETEPKKVSALADIDPAFKVDRTLSAIFDYDAGRHLTFTVSTRSVLYQRVNISVQKGGLRSAFRSMRRPIKKQLFCLTTVLHWTGLLIVFRTAQSEEMPADIGRENSFPAHIDLEKVELNDAGIRQLISAGKALFQARFTLNEGAGRPAATSSEMPTKRPKSDTPALFRTSGPDANSCQGCHNTPVSGGAGDFTANAFVAPQDIEYDFDTVNPELSMERGTTALQGAGLLELLSREMTAELHKIRADALREARAQKQPVTKPLLTKSVSFGSLTANPDGTLDFSKIQGIHPDLIIKPFSQKAVVMSLRHFSVTAMNVHHGMQPSERFGIHWTGEADFDEDGVENELTEGDVTALTLYQATLAPPVVKSDAGTKQTPSQKQSAGQKNTNSDYAAEGEQIFNRTGCNSCHVNELLLDSMVFSEPGPYNPAGNLRMGQGARTVAVDLSKMPGFEHIRRNDKGQWRIPAFTDLKRHVIADNENSCFGNEKITHNFVPREIFRTAPLWGVGSTAPYGHRGDISTLREVILCHGGEAKKARDNFAALADAEQRKVIHFLRQLVIPSAE
ncbi:hypothetical protein CHS0354_018571 [Potamilus streckersoni]|uniref:Trans-1,2-dihydrobenzene-1,2-diol dehydrogenase n=1 Tax=Potamilus streckersoni TaxID=2493646 RepID=A0AAE0WB54_9BIVA|nr:hypothetical protein CHS0354_018571 [Potamilus streckersoni]